MHHVFKARHRLTAEHTLTFGRHRQPPGKNRQRRTCYTTAVARAGTLRRHSLDHDATLELDHEATVPSVPRALEPLGKQSTTPLTNGRTFRSVAHACRLNARSGSRRRIGCSQRSKPRDGGASCAPGRTDQRSVATCTPRGRGSAALLTGESRHAASRFAFAADNPAAARSAARPQATGRVQWYSFRPRAARAVSLVRRGHAHLELHPRRHDRVCRARRACRAATLRHGAPSRAPSRAPSSRALGEMSATPL